MYDDGHVFVNFKDGTSWRFRNDDFQLMQKFGELFDTMAHAVREGKTDEALAVRS